MNHALQIDRATYSRPGHFWQRAKPILHGVSFSVERGEIFGFLGPNGAGKTTTIKAALGLLRLDQGGIKILGGTIADRDVRRRTGFMPEQPYFPESLTARELVLQHALLAGLTWRDAVRRSDAILERVGLAKASRQRLGAYSKGMLQRTGLAQALVADPELVVLDEPMSGLDPLGRREVRMLMEELRSAGKTVFFSTHIIPDVEMICDRVAILQAGHLRTVDAVDSLLEQLGTGDVEVVATNVPESFEAPQAQSRGKQTVFTLKTIAEANRIVALLQTAGATVASVQPRRGSLEDLFVSEHEETP